MWFRVEPRLSKPIYQQVVDGVKESVAKGLLQPADKLPSVRELAAEMTLNPNTVAKAYRELEHQRVIEVVRGRGTYIAVPGAIPDRAERVQGMADTVRQLLIDAHHLRMSDGELMQMVQDLMNEMNEWKGEAGGGEL